jgi:hypothetical protein
MPLATTLLNRVVNYYLTSSDFNGIRANVILGDSRPDALEILKKFVLSTSPSSRSRYRSRMMFVFSRFEQLREDSSLKIPNRFIDVRTGLLVSVVKNEFSA